MKFVITFEKKSSFIAEVEVEAETQQEANEIARLYNDFDDLDWNAENIDDILVDSVDCQDECKGCSSKQCEYWGDYNDDLSTSMFEGE
jgi:hypothetical protein